MSIHLQNILLEIPRNPVLAVGLPVALGLFSGYTSSVKAATEHSNWYQDLETPPGRPPRKIFPWVWTALYLSMGYASHLAVRAMDSAVTVATRDRTWSGFKLYYVQLGLNCLWSPLFFGKRKIGWALVDSAALTVTTIAMTKLWDGPTNGDATLLLLPYCGWLMYATYLNGGIWWLNKDRVINGGGSGRGFAGLGREKGTAPK